MAIGDNIVTHYTKQYETNARMLVQQFDHRLANTYIRETLVGEEGYTDAIGETDLKRKDQRFQIKEQSEVANDRRKYVTDMFYWWKLFDKEDQVKMLIDPTAGWMRAARAAANRKYDDIIIDALIGTSYSGKDGTTPVTLPASQKVDDTATTGMTLDKLKEIRRKFKDNDIMEGDIHIAWSPEAEEQLLSENEVTSIDYNNMKVLTKGGIEDFYGFNFILTNRLPKTSTNRTCIAWQNEGIQMAVSQDVMTDIYKDRRYVGNPWAADLSFMIGATRLEEKRVVSFGVKEA